MIRRNGLSSRGVIFHLLKLPGIQIWLLPRVNRHSPCDRATTAVKIKWVLLGVRKRRVRSWLLGRNV
jgi:hypothetical protein